MSYTRATFRDTVRTILTDKSLFRDALLNIWINDAIRDYSHFFPLEKSLTIDCVVNQTEYSLSSIMPVLGVISVEYPDGEDPPRFLLRQSETHPSFYDLPVYDLREGSTQYLVIGEKPTSADDDIILTYQTLHTLLTSDSDALTVPDHHTELLRLYCQWKAAEFIEAAADIQPPRKAALLNALGNNSKGAEYAYTYKMRIFQAPAPHSKVVGQWTMDKKDRIY
jgi:hypothetical protein